jgi:hypothetical protein
MGQRGSTAMELPSDGLTERELLIAMRGELALIRKDNEATQKDLALVRERGHEISNQVQAQYGELSARMRSIELSTTAATSYNKGEKQGFDKAVKAVYALAAVCGLGGIAAIVKVLLPALGAH